MLARDCRWLVFTNMSVWSVSLNNPLMSWSLICCSWMSCWQFGQVHLQSGEIDFEQTNSCIGSVSDWWSELKCNRCTVGLDFLVTICSNVSKSWVSFKSKRLVWTVSVDCGWVISVWICGDLVAGAFIKMALGICSDGWVGGGVVLVATGRGWPKRNIILMSPCKVVPKSSKPVFFKSINVSFVKGLSWNICAYLLANKNTRRSSQYCTLTKAKEERKIEQKGIRED